jgi:beta-galactosidase
MLLHFTAQIETMKTNVNTRFFVLLSLTIIFAFLAFQTPTTFSERTRVSIDFDWRFIQKDIIGAEKTDFDDSTWRELDLPHDWSIEGAYDETNSSGIAGAFLPTGIGWYRKVLNITELSKGTKYFIEFDGVYMNSDVYLNGYHLGNRPYGYIGFSYDLSPYLKKGKNILAVRVDHSKAPSGRWYTGSGIYRHVWLTKTSNVYVPQWGISVNTSDVSKKSTIVAISTLLNNETGKNLNIKVVHSILDSKNEIVSTAQQKINIEKQKKIDTKLIIESPNLWSPDTPYMYSLKTALYVGNKLTDIVKTSFGVRSIEIKGSDGFFLNGKPIKLRGLSNHHDAGAVGAAVPDDILYSRLRLLKDMGANALRTAHNPFSPEFYSICDTIGVMVMDEAFDGWWTPKATFDYGNYFDEWWKKDLTDFIKRDRNHPSVVIWSIGNEVRKFTAEQQKELVNFVKNIDHTRPITQGRGQSAPHIDIAGFNGHGEYRGVLENYHKSNPNKSLIGTEITHTLQTRGIYRTKTWYRTKDNPAPWETPHQFKKMVSNIYKIPDLSESELFPNVTKKYQSSYDNSIVRIGVRDDWNRVEKYDYYVGNFRWTGFDYLGESFGWPARTANFGIIDLAGFPKDHYFLYKSLWTSKPMVHVLPHWTHPGKEGVEIPVVVYTNCESAELFLNNKSFGEKSMTKERQIVWKVPYEKGTLRVVSKNNGQEVCTKKIRTAGVPNTIDLKINKSKLKANKTDVARVEVSIIDSNGTVVPYADNLVHFQINGPGKIIGVENGDILDLSPHKVNYRKAFNGKCLLLVQTTDKKGVITIKAKSNNLRTAQSEIIVM